MLDWNRHIDALYFTMVSSCHNRFQQKSLSLDSNILKLAY
ncbi:MAG: hypothetical protein EWM72_00429 [Nitrospira sp.]|nr:MAG: hypothetical protein EWM72_00429 [Nitrospira sp.]